MTSRLDPADAALVPEIIANPGYSSEGNRFPGAARLSLRLLVSRQRWVLGAGLLLGAIVFVVLTFLVPATYESSADFLVAKTDPLSRYDQTSTAGGATTIPNRDTEVELLQSRSVVESVIRTLGLRASFTFEHAGTEGSIADPTDYLLHFEAMAAPDSATYRLDGEPAEFRVTDSRGRIVASGPAVKMMRFAGIALLPPDKPLPAPLMIEIKPLAGIADEIRDRISARKLKQSTDLIRLTCRGTDPDDAHRLCGAVTNSYLQMRAAIQRSEAATAAAFLGEQSIRLEGDLEAAEDSVRSRLSALVGRPSSAVTEDRILARLQRRVTVLDERFRFVEARLREAEVAQSVDLPSVHLVDAASVPVEPASPNPPLNLAISLLVILGLGVAPAVHRERTDSRLLERQSVVAAVGAPVLTMVPHLTAPSPVISVSLSIRAGERDITLAPEWTAEREVALEAFRTLAVDLRFVGAQLGIGRLHTVAVTSATSGEGKTFTAANLAIVRASHGTPTCLVDADMRAGGVRRFFEWPPMPGLSEVLRGEAELPLVVRSARIAGNRSLHIVPPGGVSPRSSELLESSAFANTLAELEKDYEFIVVDTPPLNLLPDAASVVSLVDAVIVVVRSGTTDSTALGLTLERLDRAGARLAGVVLNDAVLPRPYSSYTYARSSSDSNGGHRG